MNFDKSSAISCISILIENDLRCNNDEVSVKLQSDTFKIDDICKPTVHRTTDNTLSTRKTCANTEKIPLQ